FLCKTGWDLSLYSRYGGEIMTGQYISYILQLITIAITLGLGLFSAYQTRKIQHGQNIISVTTNYRMKRSEQLKEYGQVLMSNTVPELFELDTDASQMLQAAYTASESISMILHRHFDADKELIELAADIADLAFRYCRGADLAVRAELVYQRKVFRLKCDMYTTADWNRIKSETKGKNTTSESWIEYHANLKDSFQDEMDQAKREYEETVRQSLPV
ncbi:MAG: hypothetical protein IJC91_04370, partial [Oscillospiraceae bacterium]|nr:hypothetical protein [Oscillospiraceae bacterium]